MHPTDEQKAEFGTLYLGGLTSKQIGDLYDCSYVTVIRHLRENGIPKDMRGIRLDKNFKLCRRCKLQLSIDKFENLPRDRSRNVCKDCRAAYKVADYEAKQEEKRRKRREERAGYSPEKNRDQNLRKKFQITLERFAEMLALQGGMCAGCGTTEPQGGVNRQWHIDHDHACCSNTQKTCGKCIRGILCSHCNTALGMVKDNPERLRTLANYLEAYDLKKVFE